MEIATPALSFAVTRPFRVVIDPGHGGPDYGTLFNSGNTRTAEKDVTLSLSLQIARQLRKRGFFVALTRAKDQGLSLPARTALANKMGADIFLSIHMNATAAPTEVEGVETYILNNASDASSRRLAHLENSVIDASSEDSPEKLDIALILKDLRLDGNLIESKRLACAIQNHLVYATSRPHSFRLKKNRGVKQALFHVLLGADMPSVLVEAGFLNSAKDRNRVLSAEGQKTISIAIARAVTQYRRFRGHLKLPSTLSMCKVN